MAGGGGGGGSAQVLGGSSGAADGGMKTTSAYWAAWVNAAASHTLEQDDLHNGSVMHPATYAISLSLCVSLLVSAPCRNTLPLPDEVFH